MYKAWRIPGTQHKIVKITLIQKSVFKPLSKKTPSGGKMKAAIILQISVQVKGILFLLFKKYYIFLKKKKKMFLVKNQYIYIKI